MSKANDIQSIDQLRQRYESFMAEKVKYETQRDAAANELSKLKKQAMELYGSDDVGKLEKMLASMKAENEQRTREYQASLDAIDKNLKEVRASFEGSESGDS
jgi:phage shock protein A